MTETIRPRPDDAVAVVSPLARAVLDSLRGDPAACDELRLLLDTEQDQQQPSTGASAPYEILTPAEAAGRARVHVETIRRAIRGGELRAGKVGRSWRIGAGDLDAWLTASPSRRSVPATSGVTPRPRAARRRPLAEALEHHAVRSA